jgi:hypothetical protein
LGDLGSEGATGACELAVYWQQDAFNFRYLDIASRLEKEEKEKFKYRTSRIRTSPYKVFTRKRRSTEQHDKVYNTTKGAMDIII